jgi:glyoxylase-like metal-dependent hydrolase (beta-lactamase superfamily II)
VIGVRADRLAGLAITHPHPDHYAGLAQILGDREVPIVATREVDAVIRRDDATKESNRRPDDGTRMARQARVPQPDHHRW